MSVSFAERFNMASYFLDDRIEEGRGDKVAVYFEDKRYTYSEVQSMSNQAGNALLGLGVEMEDRVLIVLPDSIQFVAAWFGIAKIGAVIAMVNTILPATDYEYYLEYTRAKVAIVHSSVMEKFAPAASHSPYLKHTVVVGWDGSSSRPGVERSASLVSYERLTHGASDRLETAPTSRDDIAIWLFTSGSTGHPKAAVHLHHDLPYNTECYAKQVLDIHEDDITLSVPKLFFGYAPHNLRLSV
jgi:benzoate-CoA ligase